MEMRIERTLISLEQFQDIVRNRDNILQCLSRDGEPIRLFFAPKINDH